jgi:hypothetical protein
MLQVSDSHFLSAYQVYADSSDDIESSRGPGGAQDTGGAKSSDTFKDPVADENADFRPVGAEGIANGESTNSRGPRWPSRRRYVFQ